MYEGHAVNDVWLNTLGCESQIPISLPELGGEDLTLPYMWTTLEGNRVPHGRDYNLELVVIGWDHPAPPGPMSRPIYLGRVRTLGALIYNNGDPVSLKRKLVVLNGIGGTVDEIVETRARYTDGFEVTKLSDGIGNAGRALVRFRMLWPSFYSTTMATNVFSGSTSITHLGETTTNRISIGLSGAIGQTITNTTTGESIAILGSTGGSPTIDVFNRTVTVGSTSVMGQMGFNGPRNAWMTLKPGVNNFTLSTGSATVNHWAAYL